MAKLVGRTNQHVLAGRDTVRQQALCDPPVSPVAPGGPAGAVGRTTTREQFYYDLVAFYFFTVVGSAAEDEGQFMFIYATTFLMKTLYTAVLMLMSERHLPEA